MDQQAANALGKVAAKGVFTLFKTAAIILGTTIAGGTIAGVGVATATAASGWAIFGAVVGGLAVGALVGGYIGFGYFFGKAAKAVDKLGEAMKEENEKAAAARAAKPAEPAMALSADKTISGEFAQKSDASKDNAAPTTSSAEKAAKPKSSI